MIHRLVASLSAMTSATIAAEANQRQPPSVLGSFRDDPAGAPADPAATRPNLRHICVTSTDGAARCDSASAGYSVP